LIYQSVYPKQILTSVWYTHSVNKLGEPEGVRLASLWTQLE